MSGIRSKIQQITSPTVHDRRTFTSIGQVVSTNEKNNECEVTYIDKDGNRSNKKGIHLLYADKKILSWFPKIGEKVYLQINENMIFIVGPYYENYQLEKGQTDLNKNVLSDYAFSEEGNLL